MSNRYRAKAIADREAMLTRLMDADIPLSTDEVAAACPPREHRWSCYGPEDHRRRCNPILPDPYRPLLASQHCDGTTIVSQRLPSGNEVARHLYSWVRQGIVERVSVPHDVRAFWRYIGDDRVALDALESMWEAAR